MSRYKVKQRVAKDATNNIKENENETDLSNKEVFLSKIHNAWVAKIARSFVGYVLADGIEVEIKGNKEAQEWIADILEKNSSDERIWMSILYDMSAYGQAAVLINGIDYPKLSTGLGYLTSSSYGELKTLTVNHSPIKVSGAHRWLYETYFQGGIRRNAEIDIIDPKTDDVIGKEPISAKDVLNDMGFKNMRVNVNFKNKELISAVQFLNIVDSFSTLQDIRKPDIDIDGINELVIQYGNLDWAINRETEINRSYLQTDGQGIVYSGSSILSGAFKDDASTTRSGVKEAIDSGIVIIDQPATDPSTAQPYNFTSVQAKPVYDKFQAQKQEISNEIFRIVGLKLETQTTKKAQISTVEFTSDTLEANLLNLKVNYIRKRIKELIRKIGLYGIEIGKGYDIKMKDITIKFKSLDRAREIINNVKGNPNPDLNNTEVNNENIGK